ncbi:Protein WVD2-like 5 [Cardamine amara subsp. amara]|uniref:Protein WVD2-like 5 n=1 Tax=Cardamine amara subsp. amara TaxID=228776 RepID=A0ABD1AUE0_CARAN
MDSESIMAADGTESAFANGGLTMESVCIEENGAGSCETVDTTSESQNENSGDSSALDAVEHPKEVAEGTQVENVDDPTYMKGQKAERKLKHEKLAGGKNIPSVHIKKNKEGKSRDAKVAASNGSVAPNAHTTKPLKSKSFNGREAQVTKQGKHDSAPAESADGDKVKSKPQKKQAPETSEDDTQSSNSPKADDGKPRKVGALPNYGFSFKCDQRAEKRREFYVKLEEKTHAKEEEINNMQAKSKETQEAELRMLRKSLNFKATPMPSFYQEPQPPKTELKKIPPTRPKSPKLGRKKTASGADCEETQTPRLGRLSLDEKVSKENPTAKGVMPTADLKKQPVRKSLPRLPSQKTTLPDGKPAPAKATATSAKVKPERKKLEKDAETLNKSSHPIEEEAQVTVSSNADAEDSLEIVSPRINEDRAEESIKVSEAVAV